MSKGEMRLSSEPTMAEMSLRCVRMTYRMMLNATSFTARKKILFGVNLSRGSS